MSVKLNVQIKLLFTLFSISVLSVFGMTINAEVQQKSNSKILITIERTACFGSCPVYSAQIYTDGLVIYKGKDSVRVKGQKRYRISKGEVKDLVREFDRINYFSLKDSYQFDEKGMSMTDLPTTITSISLNGRQKKIVDYYGAPKELILLENAIERIAGLDKFVI